MRVKNWNFYCDKNEKKDIADWILEKTFLWIAIGFLWLSFFHIVKEGYPAFLPSETQNQNLLEEETLEVLQMESAKSFKEGFLEILKEPELLEEGFLSIAEVYIEDWNAYYGTNYIVIDATGNYIPQTFLIIAVVGWLVVIGNAHLLRKRIFYALFPMSALLMQFLVGRSPKEDGIIYLFIGTLLLLLLEQKGQVCISVRKNSRKHRIGMVSVKISAIVVFMLSLLVGGTAFANQITKLQEKKQNILEWQQNSDIIASIEAFLRGWDFAFSIENLNNRTPQYTGKLILEIEADYRPDSNLYLKGFYGTHYENGTWHRDNSMFSEACAQSGYDEEEMGQFVSRMPFELMEKTEDNLRNQHVILQNQYQISYKESMGNTAYVPYLFDYKTLDEEYAFLGDYLLKKSVWDTSVSVDGFQNVSAMSVQRDDISSLIWNTYHVGELDSEEQRKWYNDIATEYKNVPKDMKFLSEAAEKVRANTKRIELEQQFVSYGIPDLYRNEIENNLYRANLAYAVAEYLEEIMSYSLVLDRLPVGADPIAFAMTESHEGYCMHFASAATLMLRELDVPARYASGYVVRPSDFKEAEGAENGYHAKVLDYHAHAWVEIYLDYVGWVPIEVTPGYDSNETELPTKQNPKEPEKENLSSEIETQEPELEDTQINSESINSELENPIENNAEEQGENSTQGMENGQEYAETEKPSAGLDGTPENSSGVGKWFSNMFAAVGDFIAQNLAMILRIVGLVLLMAVSIFAGKQLHVYYVKVLEDEIHKKQTRKAIKRINKRVYWYLWLYGLKGAGKVTISHGKLHHKTLSDVEYGMLLEETFSSISKEDWRRYMEIVKKMYYSPKEITEEEMMHCYKCYRKMIRMDGL